MLPRPLLVSVLAVLGACNNSGPADGGGDTAGSAGDRDGQAGDEVCVPTAEICDGEDNDCDITIDNEPQASQSCDDLDHCTTDVCSVGECIHYPSGACDLWSPTSSVQAPLGRYEHTAVWTGDEMIVWGGNGGATIDIYKDGAAYDPAANTWTAIADAPGLLFRDRHTAIWTGDEMIVWGGSNGPSDFHQDGARYHRGTDSWTSIPASFEAPSARVHHTAVWTGSEMIVWGGKDSQFTTVATGGVYDPDTGSWTATSADGAPGARWHHTAIWTGSAMIVWGGTDMSAYLADGAIYDPTADSWSAMTTAGAPAARAEHTAVWTGSEMIVWGGNDLATGGIYQPVTDSWEALPTAAAPLGRSAHVSVWTGNEMIVWGGYGYSDETHTGGVFNRAANLWRATSTAGAPAGRGYAVAAWTGSAMIAWGGWQWDPGDTFEFVNTGGRYTP